MKESTYIKYTRELHTNPQYKSLSYQYRHIFVTILVYMAFRPVRMNDHGKMIDLLPGQMMTTLKEIVRLCDEEDIDKSKVQRALILFEKIGLTRQETIHTKTVVTITESSICRSLNYPIDTRFDTGSIQENSKIARIEKFQDENDENELENRYNEKEIIEKEESINNLNEEKCQKSIQDSIQDLQPLSDSDSKPYREEKEMSDTEIDKGSIQDRYKIDTQKKNYNNYKKTTTTKEEKKDVVVFYDCLKENKDLSNDEKEVLMKFDEKRVKQALNFSTIEKPKTTLIQMLVWHCSQKVAPISNARRYTDQQRMAIEFNGYLFSCGQELIAKENETLIPEGYMLIPLHGRPVTISLNNAAIELKKDFDQSRHEQRTRKFG